MGIVRIYQATCSKCGEVEYLATKSKMWAEMRLKMLGWVRVTGKSITCAECVAEAGSYKAQSDD